jgi:hypothetical protein
MELSPFTSTIINYDSFLALRRPPYPQGTGQYSERVLKMAEKMFYNLQKGIVDSTVSTAAGLEKEDSHAPAYQALSYYILNLHHNFLTEQS